MCCIKQGTLKWQIIKTSVSLFLSLLSNGANVPAVVMSLFSCLTATCATEGRGPDQVVSCEVGMVLAHLVPAQGRTSSSL